MKNLFPFEYVETQLTNQDGSKSNFRQVFGLDGKNIACPKGSYHIVTCNDLSNLGNVFIAEGHNVTTFNHRNGEVIGLNIAFGTKPSAVGDSDYNLILTVPNNGTGRGYLTIKQTRLICTNGMVSSKTLHKNNYVKIPHTVNYQDSLDLMQETILSFADMLELVQDRDAALNGTELTDAEVLFNLNKWFFEYEMPVTHKVIEDANGNVSEMTFDNFRQLLVTNEGAIKSMARYEELIDALKREREYNQDLDLKQSMYTVYATVTNYLSRRAESSNSTAPDEVIFERASKKLAYFEKVA